MGRWACSSLTPLPMGPRWYRRRWMNPKVFPLLAAAILWLPLPNIVLLTRWGIFRLEAGLSWSSSKAKPCPPSIYCSNALKHRSPAMSSPTRLVRSHPDELLVGLVSVSDRAAGGVYRDEGLPALQSWLNTALTRQAQCARRLVRSEEHTSELQSLMRISYADFC